MKKIFLFFCCSLFIAFHAFSQESSLIEGRITDEKNNPVPGASVRLLNTNRQAFADAQGNFSLKRVPAGTVTLEVTAVGFASYAEPVVMKKKSGNLDVTLHRRSSQLDEVVVTAQKQEDLLQQLPVSVTSISAAQVQEYRLWNTKDITAIAPNLYSYDPGDKRNVTSIRGITTTSYDPAVATYIDGVNQFGLDTYIPQLFDIDHIEVLRGPQGTLYGRNAMGGVINIVTRRPANTPSGYAEVTIGNKGQQRYSLGARIPVIKDKLFIGVAGLYDRMNGFYTNDFNGSRYDKQSNFTGNYYVKYLPADQWAITLNVKHSNSLNDGPFPLVNGVNDALSNPYHLSQNAVTRMTDNTGNASLSAAYSGHGFSFTSQTAYQSNYRVYKDPIDGDFSPIDGVSIINNYGKDWNKVKVYTQEFKFSSPAASESPLKWTAGTYLFYQDNPVKQATRFGNDASLVDPSLTDKNFSTISSSKGKSAGMAFYGQATYKLTRDFDLTAGLRYDYEHKKQDILGEYQHDPNPAPVFAFRTDTSGKASFSAFSPKVSLAYHAGRNSLVFGSYSRGYRAGGLTALSADPTQPALYAFKPEYSNNVEVGVKNTLFNNRLLVNITAFYSTVVDAQVPTLVLPAAIVLTRNTGRLNSKGVEAEVSATPVKGLEVSYNFGYNQAKYTSLKLAQYGSELKLEGKRQLFTPDVTSMLALQYSYAIGNKGNSRVVVRGEWKYIGRQYFDLANTITQAGYGLLNTRFGWEGKNLSIMLWGRNLGGKKFIGYAYDFGAVHLGDPRTIGATVGVRL